MQWFHNYQGKTSYKNKPVVDPVEYVEENEDWRRNPHCPGIDVVYQGLFSLGEAHRNVLERGVGQYVATMADFYHVWLSE